LVYILDLSSEKWIGNYIYVFKWKYVATICYKQYIGIHRKKEEVLTKEFKNDIENVRADHNREAQEMMEEFNEAQELLKDKISETQIA
jgi:hypothetical protein